MQFPQKTPIKTENYWWGDISLMHFFWLKTSFTSTLAKYVDVKTSVKVLFESCKSISIDSKKFGVVFLCRHCIFLSNNLWSFRTLYSRVTFAGRCLTGDVFVCFFCVCVRVSFKSIFTRIQFQNHQNRLATSVPVPDPEFWPNLYPDPNQFCPKKYLTNFRVK